MEMPGEIPQEIGRAYASVLIGCLEHTVKPFKQQFDVSSAPEKMTFKGAASSYSFDGLGIFRQLGYSGEVLIEAKGYKKDSGLLKAYKEFLVKAYVTRVVHTRHSSDLFCFMTNVPFGSTFGRDLTSPGFINNALKDASNEKVTSILGELPVDSGHVRSLSEQLSVGIFTDSFIRLMGITYLVKEGENLFEIMSLIHANQDLGPSFITIAERIARMNNLPNYDHIRVGQRLQVPWNGVLIK